MMDTSSVTMIFLYLIQGEILVENHDGYDEVHYDISLHSEM